MPTASLITITSQATAAGTCGSRLIEVALPSTDALALAWKSARCGCTD